MKRFLLLNFSFFVLNFNVYAAPPQVGPIPALNFNPPQAERHVLSNGVVVFVLEDHELPLFSMTLRMKVSPADVPQGLDGAMGFMGTVWRTGGTINRSPEKLNQELEFFPAKVETSAGEESATISMSSLSRDIEAVLPIFADVLFNPVYNKEQLELAKSDTLESIRRKNDTPASISKRAFRDVVYGPTHLYAKNPTPGRVKKIKRKHLKALHKKVVVPDHAIISVTGDVETKMLLASLEKIFKKWKPAGRIVPTYSYDVEDVPQGSLFYVEKDFNQSRIYIGNTGIKRHDPDEFALAVGDYILGGGGGTRLWSEIRSRLGLAYVVGSFYTKAKAPGLIGVGCATKAESTTKTLQALLNEVDKFSTTLPSQQELARAKDSIVNAFVFNFESKANIVDEQARLEFFGYKLDFMTTYPKKIRAVTQSDVLSIGEKYYSKDRRKIVVVGDKSKFEEPLETIGDVVEIPLEDID